MSVAAQISVIPHAGRKSRRKTITLFFYTVARYKLVVFVGSDWREQLKRRPLSLWKVFSDTDWGEGSLKCNPQ